MTQQEYKEQIIDKFKKKVYETNQYVQGRHLIYQSKKEEPYYMKIIYIGDGSNPVNFLLKELNAFGDTYSLDENSIKRMTLDNQEITFDDLTLTNIGQYGATMNVYEYTFNDTNEHELIIYSDNQETLRFSPWMSGPPTSNSTKFIKIKKCNISDRVTSIDNKTFFGCTSLTSITIPNTVTSIGAGAFEECSGLSSVTIPNSVTSIGDEAFKGCSSLASITIPNSVTSIGQEAFYNCRGLTSVTIGNSVTSIGDYAFESCSGLTSVTIPNSVTSIGGFAFYGCSGLTSVTIPNSITSIGDWTFYNCSGLTSVTIPNSVTSIGGFAFNGCSSLSSVTMESTIPPTIKSSTFSNTTSPIYVPNESVDTYKTATNWSSYADRIQPITQ